MNSHTETPPSRTAARGSTTWAPCSFSRANSSTRMRHRRPLRRPQSSAVRTLATRLASARSQAPSFSPTSLRRGTGTLKSTARPSRMAASRDRLAGPGRSQGSAELSVTTRSRAAMSTRAGWGFCSRVSAVSRPRSAWMAGNVRGVPAPSSSFTRAVSAPWLIWLYCTPVDVPATVTSFAATSSGCPCSRSTAGAASPVHTRPPGRARKRRRRAGRALQVEAHHRPPVAPGLRRPAPA